MFNAAPHAMMTAPAMICASFGFADPCASSAPINAPLMTLKPTAAHTVAAVVRLMRRVAGYINAR